MKHRISLVLATVAMLMTSLTWAHQITIDPGLYLGQYRMQGQYNLGVKTFDLATGSHTLGYADRTNNITFHVNDQGEITTSSTRVNINGSTLNLVSVPITIDPKRYRFSIRLMGRYHTLSAGEKIFYLPPQGTGADDVGNQLQMGLGDQSNSLMFYMDPQGQIHADSSRFLIVDGNRIEFETVPVYIDTTQYAMKWILVSGYQHSPGQIKEFFLPPQGTGSDDNGSRYMLNVGGDQAHGFAFNLDTQGQIHSDTTKADINGNKITFKTMPLLVDVGDYDANFALGGVYFRGSQTINVVPAGTGTMDTQSSRYQFLIGNQANGFYIDVNTRGEAVSDTSRAQVDSQGIRFIDLQKVSLDVGNFIGQYRLAGAVFTGNRDFWLPATGTGSKDFGSKYLVQAGATSYFEITNPCAVVPSSSIPLDLYTFTLSCQQQAADTDEDGLPDSSDNCPMVANPDQIDLDADGLGDACDNDWDNDLIDNTLDNCPLLSNENQLDSDGDGLGDLCDDDRDGDGIADVSDNCANQFNPEQANSDNDDQGDVCDLDDDNDGIEDAFDNCPVTVNPDQADLDADGEGDICDGDADGDGIDNTLDQCDATESGARVTAEGCSGMQHVAHACVIGTFPNHGGYVSCVSHASKTMQQQNLLTQAQRQNLIKLAAKK